MTTSNQAMPRAILTAEERAMLTAAIEQRVQHGQVTFEEAAQLTSLPAELLRKLVRDGVLNGKAPRGFGVFGTCNLEEARQIAAKLQAARTATEGRGILGTEAAEKYQFGRNTIYLWQKAGWVQIIGETQSGDLLFNEGDIAFARALADMSGHKAGKPVFPKREYRKRN